jgi:hypothetical protein
MRVDNGAISSPAGNLYTEQAKRSSPDSRSISSSNPSSPDRSSLSSASDLVSLAKNLVPADRVQRFQAVNAAVSGGRYQADAYSVSQAIVSDHLNS